MIGSLKNLVSWDAQNEFPAGRWSLQDAEARFGELVQRVHSEGPQHVTVSDLDEVVVMAAAGFPCLQGHRNSGQALVDALQASPFRQVEIEPARTAMPVRDFSL